MKLHFQFDEIFCLQTLIPSPIIILLGNPASKREKMRELGNVGGILGELVKEKVTFYVVRFAKIWVANPSFVSIFWINISTNKVFFANDVEILLKHEKLSLYYDQNI